uniref:NADH-ubiquinone oxidoreductase chain 3 n=1 Tax=Marshallagia marshalli TaxID=106947 RepID=A0A343QXG3_9BILA|nr:NADH dehydrogenase subunit 3 [Marshallagia marshalli]ATV81506.1 NADH dehydrogenase subunit 3 [Marshallagia marshalli]
MLVLLIVSIVAVFLLLALYCVNFLLSSKKIELLKVSTFESGFMSIGKIHNSFSIHFFIVMLMFVVFDLEIVMLVGVLVVDLSSLVSFLILMMFIVVGFYMEWWYGKLIWFV